MAKSALERLKAWPQKDLIKKLGCPQDYGLVGVHTLGGKCQYGEKPDEATCKKCWTMKI